MWAICDTRYVIDFLFHSLGKVFGKFRLPHWAFRTYLELSMGIT